MATAFQSNAFQNNAFQIDIAVTPVVAPSTVGGGGHRRFGDYLRDTIRWGEGRKKKEDRVEEVAKAISQVSEVIPLQNYTFGFSDIARQMLEHERLDTLRRIHTIQGLLPLIEAAMAELDDEEALMFLN